MGHPVVTGLASGNREAPRGVQTETFHSDSFGFPWWNLRFGNGDSRGKRVLHTAPGRMKGFQCSPLHATHDIV